MRNKGSVRKDGLLLCAVAAAVVWMVVWFWLAFTRSIKSSLESLRREYQGEFLKELDAAKEELEDKRQAHRLMREGVSNVRA